MKHLKWLAVCKIQAAIHFFPLQWTIGDNIRHNISIAVYNKIDIAAKRWYNSTRILNELIGGGPVHQAKNNNKIERTLYISFFIVSALATLLSLGITLFYDLSKQRDDIDSSIELAASHISALPAVVSMLERGYPDDQVTELLDSLCDMVQDINVAVVYDNNGLRFYHTDREESGDSYVAGDEEAILSGSEPYITTGYGTHGTQRRAFHAVHNNQDEIIGFVMISVFTGNISQSSSIILAFHSVLLVVMLCASMVLAGVVTRLLRKSLMGLRPEELLGRYLRQDEVLNAVEEGLLASGPDGTILFANATAQHLLNTDEELVGQSIDIRLPQSNAALIRTSHQPRHHQTWVIGTNTIMANELPIRSGGKKEDLGVLTILFDKTELLSISDELFGARSMLETLRSFNHEFSNKLHVILGYLETGQVDQATRVILNSDLLSSQHICQTADSIRAPELSALVLGKMLRAADAGIALNLTPDSRCVEQDLLISTDDCITLIGNLLENAIESHAGCDRDLKKIELGLYCRSDCNIFICEDTGSGIPPEIAQTMFQHGCSSKGEGRGTGLSLVRRIITTYDGVIEVETEADVGTCFTITFTRKER